MANRDRERDFPVTSIGRSSGARLQPTTIVEESLAHPLGLDSPPLVDSTNSTFTQKYKPYTPRTRGTPSPAIGSSQAAVPPTITPGTLIHPPSPQHHQPAGGGDATSKLKLTNAKAEAQNVGLDTAGEGVSVGWAMLEKIVSESETGEVWAEIWSAMITGKAIVLLPMEPLSWGDRLTPEFFKDHIAFCDASSSSSSKSTQIVTLSGLRGTIHGNTITFTSTLHPSSPLFDAIQDVATRSSALRKLPPLPTSKSLHTGFPSFTITTSQTTLPLPPKPPAPKPPLPPRPGTRPISSVSGGSATSTTATSSIASSHSRIPNPFASFFGNRPSTPAPAPVPAPALQPVLAATASPTASIRSLDPPSTISHGTSSGSSMGEDPRSVVEVHAMVIQKKVLRKDVGKAINQSVRREVKSSLNSSLSLLIAPYDGVDVDVPEWVLDRVLEFCEPWLPFVRAPKTIPSSKLTAAGVGGGGGGGGSEREKEEWIVNPMEVEQFEDTVDFMQDFFAQLEDYLRVELGRGSTSATREQDEKVESEVKIRSIMELVEKTVCSLFYDRLFAQPQTDDSSHDATLSNRIAALNLLDLTLEHLDIVVENESKAEVEGVVKACGAKLCKLDSARTPKEKARILVDAHQIVVDGLSKLPPVRLMSPEQAALIKSDKEVVGDAVPTDAAVTTPVVDEPNLIISESSPPQLSASAPPAPEPPLSPLSLNTTSELPSTSTSASETTSPAPDAPSSLPSPEPTQDIASTTKSHKPTPVSSDVLLPMLIFSTVKSNPPHLVSHLLFLQRFRHRNAYVNAGNESGGGEESFCLINMLAVAEFLENVDLAGLGLGGVANETEVSAAELTPIIARSSPQTPTTPTLTPKSSSGVPLLSSSGGDGGGIQLPGSSFFLRGKVEQQVDAIAGSANKVISGVVDSSFGILRSFLPQNHPDNVSSIPVGAAAPSVVNGSVGGVAVTPTTAKPGQGGFGLLKRETSSGGVFSIANIAASIPSISSRNSNKPQGGEEGQQLVTVSSRPGSIKSFRSGRGGGEAENEEESDEEDEEDGDEDSDEDDDTSGTDDETGSEEEGSESDVEHRAGGVDIPGIQINSLHRHAHPYANSNSSISKHASASAGSFGGNATDTRSIRSFESMLSDSKKRRQQEKKLKKLAKESEKERRKEEKALRAREKEMRRGKGKNVSLTASKASSAPRKSLTDRLASVGALAGGVKDSPPDSRRSSLLPLAAPLPIVSDTSSNHQQLSEQNVRRGTSPSSSRAASPSLPLSRSPSPLPSATALPGSSLDTPSAITKSSSASTAVPVRVSSLNVDDDARLPLPQPNKRFMECASVDELSIGEVRELLSEYRRLVEGVRELGGFGI
ncbi:hypothetical protein D9756_002756 [Leucocoprinus leucothites]|uniref:VPS9 domain-containing protein n=1 Tax=Leucocoprinus leucothites TaxID=201217 RepID=A0A8H5GCW5_9AGAR|nr:hypothetical protein D9756_002756 [Leucoagaricus leucothites]